MIGFMIGVVVGSLSGVFVMCLCFVSKRGSICDDCDLAIAARKTTSPRLPR
jgi:hypothetical protein